MNVRVKVVLKRTVVDSDWANQTLMPSPDVIQLTLTLKITTAQVVETSVTINNNSPIQDYVHPDDHTQPTYLLTYLIVFLIFKENRL